VKDNIQSLILRARTDKDINTRREAIIALGYEREPEIYPVLLELLKDPSYPLQHAAVISLGRYGNPAAVSELAKPRNIRSPSADVRWATVSAIGQIGDFHVIEILARAAEDEEWVVRDQAVNELKNKIGEIIRKKEGRAAQMLVHLLDLENTEIVDLVIEGFLSMGVQYTEILLRATGASSPKMRANAARALGVVGNSSLTPHLIPLLSDHDWRVRKNSVYALSRIGEPNVIETIVLMVEDNAAEVQRQAMQALVDFGRLSTEPILSFLRHVHNKYVQRAMILTLGEIGDPRAILTLVRYLRSTYFVVRTAAIKSLVRFGTKAIPPLISGLSHNHSEIRELLRDALRFNDRPSQIRALRALGALEDHQAGETLKTGVEKGDPELVRAAERALFRIGTAAWRRCSALICLREIGHVSALPHILKCFEDPSVNVRLEAIRALAKFPGQKALQPLMKLIREERDPYLRAEAIVVIRQTGTASPKLASLAIHCLKDPDWNVRAQVAGLLGNLKKSKNIPRLVERLNDSNWSVQESAENALHNFGTEALPSLLGALRNRSASVRYRIARLIGEVGNPAALAELQRMVDRKDEKSEVLKAAGEAIQKIKDRYPNKN
jgi:HEAT repeat protein